MMTFKDLYQSYFADVFRFTVWLTRDRSQAEDITSETFVRAWARRDRLRTETLKAYLFAIARNIHRNQHKRTNKHEELGDHLTDRAPDSHRQANGREELDRVGAALKRMPERDRVAVILRSEHELSYAEIARVLEISEGSARVIVHRARRRLLNEVLLTQEVPNGNNP